MRSKSAKLGGANLAIIGMLMSVISAYYYLRVVVAMYMSDPVGEDPWSEVGTMPAPMVASIHAAMADTARALFSAA